MTSTLRRAKFMDMGLGAGLEEGAIGITMRERRMGLSKMTTYLGR